MGKRFLISAMHRQLASFTRSALRATRKDQKFAIKGATKVQTHVATQGDHWSAGVAASVAGLRRYHLFKPPGTRPQHGMPLVVMLHGCGQDARSFAASTHMNRLAASGGFLVLYPEQELSANVQACWNWFETRSGRAQKEAASILSAIDQVCASQPVDTRRIVVAGMSAGASMAAVLALQAPDRFLAIAMHSGVGPGVAESTATALSAMRGHLPKSAPQSLAASTALPALLVIHGDSDNVVAPSNALWTVQHWGATGHATIAKPRVVQRGARYALTQTDWTLGRRVVASLAEVTGLGHAWSGGSAAQSFSDPAGPDASRMVWAFAERAFKQREATRGFVA